jgi:hypothetical protein
MHLSYFLISCTFFALPKCPIFIIFTVTTIRELNSFCSLRKSLDHEIKKCRHSLAVPTFFQLVYWWVVSNWVQSALGLLCQPRVIMMMEKLVEL